jgi:hypothetical protein
MWSRNSMRVRLGKTLGRNGTAPREKIALRAAR